MPFLQAVFRKQNATLGQEMLELSYTSVTRSQVILGSISKLQSVLYVLCNVVLPYISAKIRDCQQKRDFPQSYPRVSSGFPSFTIVLISDQSWWTCLMGWWWSYKIGYWYPSKRFSGFLRFIVIVQQSSHALFFLAVSQASSVFEFSVVLCQSDELSGISLQWTVSTCVWEIVWYEDCTC